MSFDVKQLLADVFEPRRDEKVIILIDQPHDDITDHEEWQERREMAVEWRDGFISLGLHVEPIITFQATGANNAELPEFGVMEDERVRISDRLATANIVIAMTEFSATAPLAMQAMRSGGRLRVASMPGVTRRMETTALAEDYHALATRVHVLAERLTRAVSADLTFSTEHQVHLDLRHRSGCEDNGHCPPGAKKPLINLPSGEAFIVPYEGELEGVPAENKIHTVTGEGPEAQRLAAFFKEDPARANVAELGLGCNSRAVVTGNLLEDEKAGLHWAYGRSEHHWAYGRSEHLGGITGPDAFLSPKNVIHMDVVYTGGCPIGTRLLTFTYPDGETETIMRDNEYCCDG